MDSPSTTDGQTVRRRPGPTGATTRSDPGAMVADSLKAVPARADVEQVDLAVDGLHRPRRADQAAGVGQAVVGPVACPGPLGEAARQQVDAVAPGQRRGPGHCGAVQGLGVLPQVCRAPGHREVLRQDHQLGTGGCRLVHQDPGAVQVGPAVRAGRRLDGCHAHGTGYVQHRAQ